MAKFQCTLLSLVMVWAVVLGTGYARGDEVENLLQNGGFEDGIADPWGTYGDASLQVVKELKKAAVDEDPIEGDFCLHVTVFLEGANFWDSGLDQAGPTFEAGKVYTLSAYLKSKEGPMQINFKPELAADPWTGYGSRAFVMTEEWREFHITTPPMPGNVSPTSLTFHIGYGPGEFWMDDVKFYEGEYVGEAEGPEVGLMNGGFELGLPPPWGLYGSGSMEVVKRLTGAVIPEDPIEGKYALHVTVNEVGDNFWDVGMGYPWDTFERGKVYTLAAFLKSKEGPLQINFKPELDQDPWTGYGAKEFTMTEEWQEYYITTPPMPTDVSPASLTFHIGYTKGEFWMDGVRFFEGEYEEPDFSEQKAVKPHGKLGTVWGRIKAD